MDGQDAGQVSSKGYLDKCCVVLFSRLAGRLCNANSLTSLRSWQLYPSEIRRNYGDSILCLGQKMKRRAAAQAVEVKCRFKHVYDQFSSIRDLCVKLNEFRSENSKVF